MCCWEVCVSTRDGFRFTIYVMLCWFCSAHILTSKHISSYKQTKIVHFHLSYSGENLGSKNNIIINTMYFYYIDLTTKLTKSDTYQTKGTQYWQTLNTF